MDIPLTKTEDIAKEFANASKLIDIPHLESLLDENGEFEIQNDQLDIIHANKEEFIKWYEVKLKATAITDIEYDQCLHCHIGNTVIIFNDGKFPRTIKDISERSKTGLMVDAKDGKIMTIKFCFVFLKTENKYQVDCIIERFKQLRREGLSFEEAYSIVADEDPLP